MKKIKPQDIEELAKNPKQFLSKPGNAEKVIGKDKDQIKRELKEAEASGEPYNVAGIKEVITEIITEVDKV